MDIYVNYYGYILGGGVSGCYIIGFFWFDEI